MQRIEEWDFPPRARRRRYYRTVEYQPRTGWSSPSARKAVNIFWRVMIGSIKALLAIPLALAAIGSFWLFLVCVKLMLQ